MKTKRKRNGIKTVMFTLRLDEDIHKWLKESGVNASAIINEHLRELRKTWYKNIPPYDEPYNEGDPLPF